jgi:hypothetical protein
MVDLVAFLSGQRLFVFKPFFHDRVDMNYVQFMVQDADSVLNAVEHAFQELFLFPDFLLLNLLAGDVHGQACIADNPAGGVFDREGSGPDPAYCIIRTYDPVFSIESAVVPVVQLPGVFPDYPFPVLWMYGLNE